jgi:hypothetical protein
MAYEPDTDSLAYPQAAFENQQCDLLRRRYSEGWILTSTLHVHGMNAEDRKVFYFFERTIPEKKAEPESTPKSTSAGRSPGPMTIIG